MKRIANNGVPEPRTEVRCAIYTRKSTDEGLEKEFNSLDAQRDAGELFVRSQAHEGWVCLPDRYDDGGFTGGNMERPGLERLMADIEARKVHVVVVYKVDRLSRSLLDFTQMMQTFEEYKVSFVSVTQHFNTANSMGRLMLHVLLSFAQFEREIISERTRDKIAATRRKGKWAGGHPILGYDVDPNRFRLQVNAEEAERVRGIFKLYLEHESLLPVVEELNRRGWLNKLWTTRKGHERGGKIFTRTSLYKLLTNIAYIGKVRYKNEVHPGEHKAIVDVGVWQRVQTVLERNGNSGGAPVRNKFGALLKGMIRCVPCNSAMTPTHSTRGAGSRRYRYYVCCRAQKLGWDNCVSKAVPAAQIEQLVVRQVKAIGNDPHLLGEVMEQARQQDAARIHELEAEKRELEKSLGAGHDEMQALTGRIRPGDDNSPFISKLADLQEQIAKVEQRMHAIRDQIQAINHLVLDPDETALAMSVFDPVWEALTSREQIRVLELLVERVDYDGSKKKVSIVFRPTGIKTLAHELNKQRSGRKS